MSQNWSTKEKDLFTARLIMEKYAQEQEVNALGLFEVVVNLQEKRMSFRLSDWVVVLAQYFKELYGETQGDFVTRKVISSCMMKEGETLH